MKNFSTWLLVMFAVMFWGFRVVVALMAQMEYDFGGIAPLNLTLEVVLLFVALICFILIVKRKMAGALLYLVAYGIYFGTDLFNRLTIMMEATEDVAPGNMANAVFAFIGIILPVAVLLDLLADKNRKANPKDKRTDWFFKNEKFDRKLDERADKNNYRTL